MGKADFEDFRLHLHRRDGEDFVIIDVDSEGEQVEIRQKGRSSDLYGKDPFIYVSTFISRCHWSETEAWYHGHQYGIAAHRYDPKEVFHSTKSEREDTIEKLKELGLWLEPNSENSRQFYVVRRSAPANRVYYECDTREDSPTYETLSQIERWLDGRLFGIAEYEKYSQ